MDPPQENAGGRRARRWYRFQRVTIGWSLFWNMLVLILVIALALALTTSWTARRAVRILSRPIIKRTGDLMELELVQFFRPMQSILRVTGAWVASGELDVEDPLALQKRLMPTLFGMRQISSFSLGDAAGGGYMVLQTGSNCLSREIRRSLWGNRVRWRRWDDANVLVEEWWEESDYDPRQRPWYQAALQDPSARDPAFSEPIGFGERQVFWTPPYRFFTTREWGVTASMALEVPGETNRVVIALDVRLEDISDFTRELAPSPEGFVFVIAEEGTLIGMPHGRKTGAVLQGAAPVGEMLEQQGEPVAADGVRAWEIQGRTLSEPFRFQSDGEEWWGGIHSVDLGENRHFWVGVMVPARDFLVDVWRQRANFLVIMGGALAVATGMVLVLSRKYSRPLRHLVRQSERIQELNLEGEETPVCRLAEVHALTQAQERMRRALASFARYVPMGVVRELVRRGEAAQLGGRTEVLTVMFSDIEGFTGFTERMPPEVLTQYLAEYFEVVERVLDEYQGTVDKFIGDAVLAFWGAPNPQPDHARAAALAVQDVRAALEAFHRRALASGQPAWRTRFGLATGPVVVGNIGAPDRLNYSVIGNTVNLASRLEGLNRFYGTTVLGSQSLVVAAGEDLVWRRIDRVVVQGQTQAVDIFELLGRAGEVSEEILEKKKVYESALDSLQGRRFQEGLDRLCGAGRPYQGDLSFQRLAERCEQFLRNAPSPDWDTSFRFPEK